MAAVSFTPGAFYHSLSTTFIPVTDVEDYPTCLSLGGNDVIWCERIVFRKGARGRGHYAKCRVRRSEHYPSVVFYHRVSKNRIGAGDWEEVNEMMVLALADVLPLD
jgi:hypothetical protein